MATFTASDIPSSFAPPNALLDLASVDHDVLTNQHNALLNQDLVQNFGLSAEHARLENEQLRQNLGLSSNPALDAALKQAALPLPGQRAPAAQSSGTSGSDGTFEPAMGSSESGNDPTKVNAGGYSGRFQFGAARLADLGYYTPAEGEDLSKNQWKGTFNIPGFAVTTHDDFLKNDAAQHAVLARMSLTLIPPSTTRRVRQTWTATGCGRWRTWAAWRGCSVSWPLAGRMIRLTPTAPG